MLDTIIDKAYKKLLFNPKGDDSLDQRTIIKGNTTNLFNLNDVKYSWANSLYRWMMSNFWIPEKVDLSIDSLDYRKLSDGERNAYNGILSFLVFLDSIQTNNIPKIADYITAPEVSLLLAIQDYQEAIHSQGYAYLIESTIPKESRKHVYEFWREDPVLFERNQYIAQVYQDFIETASDHNFFRVLVANYLLEGLYFYNGFTFFYTLASRALCSGTSSMIRYINRDEYSHCILFEKIIQTIKIEFPEIFNDNIIFEMVEQAVEQEIKWSKHILREGIIGISNSSIEAYTKWLADDRLKKLGLPALFNNKFSNPYEHLNKIADVSGDGDVKGNFFESTVTSYNQSTAISGWDRF